MYDGTLHATHVRMALKHNYYKGQLCVSVDILGDDYGAVV